VKPIIIDHLQIVLNMFEYGKEKNQCRPTEQGSNSCGSKEKEHHQPIEPKFNSSALKQEQHHHPRTEKGLSCMCAEQSNSTDGRFVCECFSMAEPYMLMGHALTILEKNGRKKKQEKHHQPRTEKRFSCMCAEKSNSPDGKFICECFSMAEPYMLMEYELTKIEKNGGEQRKKKTCSHRLPHRHSNTSISSKQTIEPVNVHRGSQMNGVQKYMTGDLNKTVTCSCWCHMD
jgi:hypothetical protein